MLDKRTAKRLRRMTRRIAKLEADLSALAASDQERDERLARTLEIVRAVLTQHGRRLEVLDGSEAAAKKAVADAIAATGAMLDEPLVEPAPLPDSAQIAGYLSHPLTCECPACTSFLDQLGPDPS